MKKIQFVIKSSGENLKSIENLKTWLNEERESWQWLNNVTINHSQINPIWVRTKNQWAEIDKSIKYLENPKESNLVGQNIINIQNCLETLYETRRFFTSSSPEGKFILSIKEKEPTVAGYLLLELTQPSQNNQTNPNSCRALMLAQVFKYGLAEGGAKSEKDSLKSLQSNWNEFIKTSKDEWNECVDNFETIKKNLNQTKDNQENQFIELINKFKSNINDIEKTFNEKLSLQAPVQYWRNRSHRHLKASIFFTILFIVLTLLLGNFVLWEFNELLVDPETGHFFATEIPYWKIVFLFGSISIGIWPLHITIKLILSNLHLMADASEKVTIANTFLSLLKEDQNIGTNERLLVFESLFRNANSGLIKSDTPPPTPQHIISKIQEVVKK